MRLILSKSARFTSPLSQSQEILSWKMIARHHSTESCAGEKPSTNNTNEQAIIRAHWHRTPVQVFVPNLCMAVLFNEVYAVSEQYVPKYVLQIAPPHRLKCGLLDSRLNNLDVNHPVGIELVDSS